MEKLDLILDSLEAKGLIFTIVTGLVGLVGLGGFHNFLLANGYHSEHYVIGAIGHFVWIAMSIVYYNQQGIVFVNKLDVISRAIWNIIKINSGGLLALFFTPFVSQKFLTVFIGYEWPLAFLLGISAHYFVKWIEKVMKWKEKQFDETTGTNKSSIQSLTDDDGAPKPPSPPIIPPNT